MPRQPRNIEPGTEYHLISRFVDREWFIKKTHEREHYLKLLGNALEDSDWRLTAYAVMSNHIHLKCVAGEQALDRWIRKVHSPFADAMNRSHDRIGSVFVRGPKAYPITPDGSAHLLAYIHNNPVRAELCADAAGTDWTSHRAYIGQAPVPPWLYVGEGLLRAGFTCRNTFDAWVNDPARADTEFTFTEEHYAQAEAQQRIAAGSRRRDVVRESAEQVATVTASSLGITVSQLRSTSRGDLERLGRAVAVHSARMLGLSGRSIADALQISPARVSALLKGSSSANVKLLADCVAHEINDRGASSICERV